jgi:hypothetical protein
MKLWKLIQGGKYIYIYILHLGVDEMPLSNLG